MPNVWNGTNGDDTLIVADNSDWTINGLGGNDHLVGGGGNDTIDGGPGNDVITGGAGHDVLTGGTGVDVFQDTAANLNGDEITDFLPGDHIQITDLAAANANLQISGHSLLYGSGDSVTIDNLGPGRYIPRATSTGVDIQLQQNAHNDFNGDGRSDILWRNDNGTVSEWQATPSGGFAAGPGSNVSADWHIIGTGDFNGDGRDDILWRNDNGQLTEWISQADGSWADNSAHFSGSLSTTWQLAGTADFNGDGRTDILWRNSTDGTVSEWLAQANGSFVSGAGANVGPNWTIAGTGDFNDDGHGDVLWRNSDGTLTEWLGQDSGGWIDNGANLKGVVDTSWQIVGTGDMNGDGMSDILWRKSDGTVSEWLASSDKSGAFVSGAGAPVGFDWHIVGMGDYNGDGIDDVFWRNDNGNLVEWLGQVNGGWVSNAQNASGFLSNTWHVQDPFF